MKSQKINMDLKIINNIKALAIDMIDAAGSGHPGIVLGAAPMMYTLYAKHLMINSKDDKWLNRDRFIMSAGHGSALLYSTLFALGYDLSLDDLRNFRRKGFKTPGHPELNVTPGVDFTTGPLGQGFASAVGFAMAEKFLASKYNNSKKTLFNYNTYVLCSDGDLMEGVSSEAASLAGHLKLGNLIVLYDSNNVSLDGQTKLSFTEDVLKKYDAMGWQTLQVKNGDSVNEIDKAIIKAKKDVLRPTIIEIKTIIGKDSYHQNTSEVHGKPLSKDDILQLKEKLDVRGVPFTFSNEASEAFKQKVIERVNPIYKEWKDNFTKISEDIQKEIIELSSGKVNITLNLSKIYNEFSLEVKEPMREINSDVMNTIGGLVSNFWGGTADLSSTTKTFLEEKGVFSSENRSGKNIYFGVREHAMGAILNGIAASGMRVFGSTFLAFSDYLRPALRIAAISNLPVTYIFTHDSINIGSDGPTHQPIEQLESLRSIPNFAVYRPADTKEIVGSWESIFKSTGPNALIISRNEVSNLINTSINDVNKGAYIVRKEKSRLMGIIISTGSEVELALNVAEELYKNSLDLRVVSMPCQDKFSEQSKAYQEDILPYKSVKIVIEPSASNGLYKYATCSECVFGLEQFGVSGNSQEVVEEYNFTVTKLKNRIEKLFR